MSLLGVAAVNAAPQLGLDFSGLTSLSDTSSLSSISTAADEPFDVSNNKILMNFVRKLGHFFNNNTSILEIGLDLVNKVPLDHAPDN